MFDLFNLRQHFVLVLAPLSLLILQQGLTRAYPALTESDEFRLAMLGLVPALYSARTQVLGAKESESAAPPERSRVRAGFVIGQVAISALLLAMTVTEGPFVYPMTFTPSLLMGETCTL